MKTSIKTIIIIFTVVTSGMISCKENKENCENLYTRWTGCLHEQGKSIEELKAKFQSKDQFVAACKKTKENPVLPCLKKSSCSDFVFCAEMAEPREPSGNNKPSSGIPDMELKQIYDGAVAYIENPQNHMDPATGEPIAISFPGNTEFTPGTFDVRCKQGGQPVKVSPKNEGANSYDGATVWGASQIWKKLKVEMRAPHHFVFKFISNEKSFKAIAKGDLNCDGKPEYYWRGGTFENGVVTGTPDTVTAEVEPEL